jgi:hypothetical protein
VLQRIGFDREIKLEWLSRIASLIPENYDIKILKSLMTEYLSEFGLEKEVNRKTYQVLKRIWYGVPDEHINLRNEAIQLLDTVNEPDELVIHWGMSLLAYPFFKDIVEIIGSLSTLQTNITREQVSKRLDDRWGARTTSRRALNRVLQSLVWWGVLKNTRKQGQYILNQKRKVLDSKLIAWLIYIIILTHPSSALPIKQIPELSICFPFAIRIKKSKLLNREDLIIFVEGYNLEMIAMK